MRNSSIPKLLLASIHDVSPRFEPAVEQLCERLNGLLGEAAYAMLVVPDFWDEAPLTRSPRFRSKLRAWSDQGIEMFLHGWNHRDAQQHRGLMAAFKARHMTAGEGEFLGLDRAAAARRMNRGRALVEDAIGRPVAGFIAPAWLYGAGALLALRDEGFALAEDHLRVWRPADGAILSRSPVITWASRSRARVRSSVLFAAVARRILVHSPVVRVAVHPGDTGCPEVLGSLDRTAAALLKARAPGRYADLMRNQRRASVSGLCPGSNPECGAPPHAGFLR